ncbi:MAG TPA: DNA repair protein RadC [Thermodesulfobacteriota bacterium]|nr:DNA repair protein RadC [Thermodesulfobacteriota bacterium]
MIKLLKNEEPLTATEHRRRLKDRFKKGALEGFHDYEILELLFLYAVPKKDVKHLARSVLKRFRGIRGVFDATADELKSVEGVGENAAVLIKLVKDLTGVYLKERMMSRDVMRCTKDVLNYLNVTLSGERVEKFIAIYLNARNEVLAVETLHEGTINQTAVYPRKAIEKAFKHNARSVIFVHNHPSGDATPSSVDKQLTRVLDRAALAVDLLVHDHLIIGKNKHFSARENGWIIGYPGAAPHKQASP